MLMILSLPYYFALNSIVPPFFPHSDTPKEFLNLKLYK